jgi:hypothetical protein
MDDLLQLFQDGATYLINGALRVIYALGDHGPHLIGLLCALIMAGLLDRWTAALITAVPARLNQPVPRRSQPRPYVATAITFTVWAIATGSWPPPVPALGAAMWVATVLAVLALPTERVPVLARGKSLIVSYAVVLLVGGWMLNQTAAASPRDWAALIGGVGEAQDVLAQNRGLITTLITLGVMWWGPVATLVYLGQRVQLHLGSLVNPWQTAADIVREIQTRDGRS